MRQKVIKLYKQILQTSKEKFGEDKETLNRVVQNIRTKFKENKNESDPVKIEENIKIAETAKNFIENNIIQGTYSEGSNLRLKIPKDIPSNAVIEPIDKIKIK